MSTRHFARAAVLLAITLLPATPAGAESAPYLVRDLTPDLTANSTAYGSGPVSIAAAGSRFVFSARRDSYNALWVTDGTPEGTASLAGTCAQGCGAPSSPLVSTGTRVLWFSQVLGHSNFDLWGTDGTASGTVHLADDAAGLAHFQHGPPGPAVVVLDGLGYFWRQPPGASPQLWSTDGTPSGSRLLRDFATGPGDFLANGVATENAVFLSKPHPGGGDELWRSDGTPSGTKLVSTIPGSVASGLHAGRARIFFRVSLGDRDVLYTSDGTAAGTRQVSNFPNAFPFTQDWMKLDGDRVYFPANDVLHGDEIWTSDGTSAGTRQATDFGFANPFAPGALYEDRAVVTGGKLFFFATDGFTPYRLWVSAGSPGSEHPVPDGCDQDCYPAGWVDAAGGRALYFRQEPSGLALWSTDGTASGSERIDAPCAAGCFSDALAHAQLNGDLFFSARGLDYHLHYWRSHGSPETTVRLDDFSEGGADLHGEDMVVDESPAGVLFAGDDGVRGLQPWFSPGTPRSAILVEHLLLDVPSSAPESLTALPGGLLFCPYGVGNTAWISDGTEAGTAAIGIENLQGHCFGDHSLVANGLAFLRTQTPLHQLWRTDGTLAGSYAIADLDALPVALDLLTVVDSGLRALAGDSGNLEVWQSDGTIGGTHKRYSLPSDVFPMNLEGVGKDLFFAEFDVQLHQQLMRVDDDTGAVTNLTSHTGTYGPAVEAPTAFSGGVAFRAYYDTGRLSLWYSDGSPGSARQIAPAPSILDDVQEIVTLGDRMVYLLGSENSTISLWSCGTSREDNVLLADGFLPGTLFGGGNLRRLARLGSRVFAVLDDTAHGFELWVTDGSPGGTRLVEDIVPGPESSFPRILTPAGDVLVFDAWTADHGTELWVTDGTAEGTRRATDVNPGAEPADPEWIALAANHLFFSADDGLHGRELWAIDLTPGAPTCAPSSTALCLNGGRFRVQSVWRDFQGNTGEGTAVGLTPDSGYFWFFDSANVEALLKVLDGTGVNGHHWVFYGALSNVEYTFDVTDTVDGSTRRYFNPPGRYASVGDVEAFGPNGAHSGRTSDYVPAADSISGRFDLEDSRIAASGSCVPSSTTLCLRDGQFAVSIAWTDFQGNHGSATTVPFSNDTGLFWFFNPENIEMALKVLDGRPINGKFWVYYGALSNVEFHVTVTDTLTGHVKTYTNPAGVHASVGDVDAF